MSQLSSIAIQPLDPFTLPLDGVRLIEASAGTGKTYTITSLYVRLVLGHNCKALSPEQILVVTFTRAATEELRGRIRGRLKQAHDALVHASQDDLLINELTDFLSDAEVRKQSIQRLKDAQQLMDMSAIFTIHGFCQRMLSQNAFESKGGFEDALTLEEGQYIRQAVRDVWRTHVYPMDSKQLDLVLERWQTPDALEKHIRPYLNKNLSFHFGAASGSDQKDEQHFEQLRQQWSESKASLAASWSQHRDEFYQLFAEHPEKNGQFTRFLDGRFAAIDRYLLDTDTLQKDDADKLKYFNRQGVVKSVKKNGTPPDHTLIHQIELWLELDAQYQAAKKGWLDRWLVEQLANVQQRLEMLKQQQQLLSSDDLLLRLNQAIHNENGQHLIEQIRRQFPVAMVDEFQDTDGLQYGIFQSLYVRGDNEDSNPIIENSDDLALFMIGDPKQAIYKFRGADIFTYIQAKHQVDGVYSLDTNYRSSQSMVDAVNSIFTQHDQPFIYDADIPFQVVKSADIGDPLTINGTQQSALTWQVLTLNQSEKIDDIRSVFAHQCAERISELLNQSLTGSVSIHEKPVHAKDIAVLVRNGKQAELVKQALAQRNIASVYVGRDNIFATEEALCLYSLLSAIHEQNERQFKNALAMPLWGLTLNELQTLNHDEQSWEQELDNLNSGLSDWQYKGVMCMIMNWLHKRDLPQTWLAWEKGERLLTNVLHLAELLQQASVELQGMQGLLSWFAQQLAQAHDNKGENDTQQLRLESDDNLVQITTLHKSKGLEYPIVFMPFLWDGQKNRDTIFFDEETGQARCDLAGDYKERIEQEGLAEEVRLLYVGLTRAVSKCYVGLYTGADDKWLSNIQQSALKYTLAGAQSSIATVIPILQALAEEKQEVFDCESLTMASLDHPVTKFVEPESDQSLHVRAFNGQIKKAWRLSSFSSLIKKVQAPAAPKFDLDDDNTLLSNDVVMEEAQEPQRNAFTFPRGAHAGNFLHNLLEDIDFTDGQSEATQEVVVNLLERYGFDHEIWSDTVMDWLTDILETPLQHPELKLANLTEAKKLVEMEFYFPVSQLKASGLNNLLGEYPCLNVPTPEVDFFDLKGMLKGFIDLIFEHDGQYFVLDYKSNHLGDHHEDYHDTAVQEAMAKNRYDVQMVIYTLALHRLLQLRIPDYDYDRHIGGGYYLFLRGMDAKRPEQTFGQYFHKPDRALIEGLDDMIKQSDVNTEESTAC